MDPGDVLDSIFEHADFGVGLWDAELRFVRLNQALARINRTPIEEHLGRRIDEVLSEIDEQVVEILRRVVETGESVTGIEIEGPGDGRAFDCSYHPVRQGGQTTGVWASVTERTAEREVSRQLEEDLADEHRIATQLQVSLMPERLPAIPGIDLASTFRPAGDGHEIGGDFYDVFAINDGCWMIVLGDVCGKGAEAAALTALARYTLRAAAIREGAEPATLLTRLNEAIQRQRDDMRFLSAVCIFLDVDHDGATQARVCVAGHQPPVLARPGGEVRPLGKLGPVLGVWDDPALTEEHVRLERGSRIVLYTDGVLDARSGGELTEEGLAELVANMSDADAIATVHGIENAVLSPGERGRDDIAILVIRVP